MIQRRHSFFLVDMAAEVENDWIAEVGDLINWLGTEELLEDEVVEERFGNTSQDELSYLTRKHFAENTSLKIVSVMKLFKSWVVEKNRKLRLSVSSVPSKSLEEWSTDDLNRWLPAFINEIRKSNGDHYRAKTLMEYVVMLQCHLQAHGIMFQFLRDSQFHPIKNCLENVMKERQKRGLG